MQALSSVPTTLQRRAVSPLADELSAIFTVIDDEPLLATLAKYRWTGRPGWSLRALWRAYVSGYMLGLPTTNALVRRLQEDIGLRDVCGFDGELPSRWTFNRALNNHCRRGLRKVALHAMMGLLTVQAGAVANVLSGDLGKLRCVSRKVA